VFFRAPLHSGKPVNSVIERVDEIAAVVLLGVRVSWSTLFQFTDRDPQSSNFGTHRNQLRANPSPTSGLPPNPCFAAGLFNADLLHLPRHMS
jgi:hypothetical protein